MPKIRHFARHSGIPLAEVWKFALLNEYIIYRLTGELYGDTTNWWTPTETALVGMCNLAGFPEVNALVPVPDAQPGEIRHYRCVARANRG